jgi:hypothetical protein
MVRSVASSDQVLMIWFGSTLLRPAKVMVVLSERVSVVLPPPLTEAVTPLAP